MCYNPRMEEGLITLDLLCFRCRYNLRTRPAAGVCPECATPIAKSAEHARRLGGLRVARMFWGAVLLAGLGAVFFGMGAFVSFVFPGVFTAHGVWWVVMVGLLELGTRVPGALLVATCRPRAWGGRWSRVWVGGAVVAVAVLGASQIASGVFTLMILHGVTFSSAQVFWIFPVGLSIVSGFLNSVLLAGAGRYMAGIFVRLAMPRMAGVSIAALLICAALVALMTLTDISPLAGAYYGEGNFWPGFAYLLECVHELGNMFTPWVNAAVYDVFYGIHVVYWVAAAAAARRMMRGN